MYDFTHLLDREDAHDVVFKAVDNSASVGMSSTVLAGLSERWRAQTGTMWAQSERDEKGGSIHHVDLGPEAAQEVLSAFQTIVFTGKLITCSPKVLVMLARLADAELMPAVLKAVLNALSAVERPFTDLTAEQIPGTIKFLATQVDHVEQLQDWLIETAKKMAGDISGNDRGSKEVFEAVLQELPQDSCAALGVLQVAVARWPYKIGSIFSCLHDGLVRHKKVVCARPGRWLLEDIRTSYMTPEAREVVYSVSNAFLGSPSHALSSDEAFEAFCSKVFQPRPILYLWEVYVAEPNKAYLALMKKVHDRQKQESYRWPLSSVPHRISKCLPSNFLSMFEEHGDGLKVFSPEELRELVVPCMRASQSSPGKIKTVELLAAALQREHELQQQLAEARAALQQQGSRQGSKDGRKRSRRE